jgi:hypothetical protein
LKLWFSGLCLLVLAASEASPQSLVEIASGERARRETLERERQASSAFTNVGVRTRVRRETLTLACILTRESSFEADEDEGRAYWERLDREARTRKRTWEQRRYVHAANLEHQRARLETLRAVAGSCGQGGVSIYFAEPWGNAWASQTWGLGSSLCGAVPEAIRTTESAIARIRAAAYDDARRLRIPPGLVGLE